MEWRLPEELINYILDTACEPYQELVHYFEWPSNTPELVDHDRRSRVVRRKLAGIFDSICKKITRSRRNRVGSVLLGFDWANFCVPYSNITELVLHSNPFEKANISSERVSEAMIENSIAFLRRLTVSELRRLESVTINLIPPFHLPPHKIIIRLFSYLPTTLKRLKISIHMLSSKDLCVILETLSRFRQLQHLDIDGHLLELMSTEYSAEDDFIRGDRPRFARVLTEALQNCKSTLKSLGLPNIFDLIYDMRRFPDLSSLSALEDLVLHTFISKEPQVLNYDLGDDGKTLPPFIQFCRDNLPPKVGPNIAHSCSLRPDGQDCYKIAGSVWILSKSLPWMQALVQCGWDLSKGVYRLGRIKPESGTLFISALDYVADLTAESRGWSIIDTLGCVEACKEVRLQIIDYLLYKRKINPFKILRGGLSPLYCFATPAMIPKELESSWPRPPEGTISPGFTALLINNDDNPVEWQHQSLTWLTESSMVDRDRVFMGTCMLRKLLESSSFVRLLLNEEDFFAQFSLEVEWEGHWKKHILWFWEDWNTESRVEIQQLLRKRNVLVDITQLRYQYFDETTLSWQYSPSFFDVYVDQLGRGLVSLRPLFTVNGKQLSEMDVDSGEDVTSAYSYSSESDEDANNYFSDDEYFNHRSPLMLYD